MNCIKLLTNLSVVVCVFNSCSKENSVNTPPITSASLPKTYTESLTSATAGNSSDTYNLTYDANNRITSSVDVVSTGPKTIYTYKSNSTFSVDLYDDGTQLSIHEDFFLNGSSFVDSTIQFNDTQDTTSEKYFYNSSGQLASYNEYDYFDHVPILSNTTTYTYDANGNETSETDNNGVTTFTYTTTLNPIFLAAPYMKSNKNLVLTSTNSGITITHTYAFDSSKRLTMDKGVASNGDVIVKSYTY